MRSIAQDQSVGRIVKVSGPAVIAKGLEGAKLNDIVFVGTMELLGEVIRITGDEVFLQIFEDTTSLLLGEPIKNTGAPLKVTLAPGLLGGIYDGVQRPLHLLEKRYGHFIKRGGGVIPAVDYDHKWAFVASVQKGNVVGPGSILGTVEEKPGRTHRIMVAPGMSGTVKEIQSGDFTVNEVIAVLDNGQELRMLQEWPVKTPRPVGKKLDPIKPFVTGQRVLDALFPISLGGSAILPGGFGTGKTVVEHMLAKYSNADIIVYIGCGERGNEMTDVLKEFPNLIDPYTCRPLMERTILIANTSNMPVAAREASVYAGVTIAEYYRDMGYHVAVLADSTSRWAEAMREISSRLEEMPGEEGFPTYLATRLSGFYERSGRVNCMGSEDREGSITIVGAVSPPGGDYSEPVTQNSQRVTGAVWALDASLAYRRHFPAINWNRSYTLYHDQLKEWFCNEISESWMERIGQIQEILQKDAELQEIVQLVGPDGLLDSQRIVLEMGRSIRQDFLQQNAFSDIDAFCSLKKQKMILDAIYLYYQLCTQAISAGVLIDELVNLEERESISRLKDVPEESIAEEYQKVTVKLSQVIQEKIDNKGV